MCELRSPIPQYYMYIYTCRCLDIKSMKRECRYILRYTLVMNVEIVLLYMKDYVDCKFDPHLYNFFHVGALPFG